MDHIIYYADKTLKFTTCTPSEAWYVVLPEADISRDKILKILEMHNFVAVVSPSPEEIFATFAAEFTPIEAAGGIAVNAQGAWLMIHRNGRWDLPKGHLERGERIDECAVREVEEETGVATEVVRPLCKTLHIYYMHARWELKRTHWYELRALSSEGLQPQTEEGIERVVWCDAAQVAAHLREAFPTIRCVAAEMQL
ncbi:MAG: NUDIX domain-containing protein [Alistipes sp.]